MTINEASVLLTAYFIKNDSITNELFKNIVGRRKIPPYEYEAAFSCALQEFETKGIVSKFINVNDKGVTYFAWVLRKPIFEYSQKIDVNGHLAVAISNAVNSFFDSTNQKGVFSNPLQIQEQDLIILLEIIDMYASSANEEDKEPQSIEDFSKLEGPENAD